MKRFILTLLSILTLFTFVEAQSPEMDSPQINNGLWFRPVSPRPQANKRKLDRAVLYYNDRNNTFEFTVSPNNIVALPTIYVTDITAVQINAGDSVQILPAPSSNGFNIIDKIVVILDAGTAYTQSSTDSTFISCTYMGTTNKPIHITDEYFIDTNDKIENVPYIGGIDQNSSVWINFADGYTTGTGTITVLVYYFIKELN